MPISITKVLFNLTSWLAGTTFLFITVVVIEDFVVLTRLDPTLLPLHQRVVYTAVDQTALGQSAFVRHSLPLHNAWRWSRTSWLYSCSDHRPKSCRAVLFVSSVLALNTTVAAVGTVPIVFALYTEAFALLWKKKEKEER